MVWALRDICPVTLVGQMASLKESGHPCCKSSMNCPPAQLEPCLEAAAVAAPPALVLLARESSVPP